jgi:hypothetical protein
MSSDQMLFDEMEKAVRAFDAGRLTFRAYLDRLETCVDHLSDDDGPWKDEFRRQWGRMEDAYAYAASEGLKTIREGSMPAVEAAIAEVKRLIAEKTAGNS